MKLTVVGLPGQQPQMGQQQPQQQQMPEPQGPQGNPQQQGIGQQLANSPLANIGRAGIGLASDIGADIAGTPGNIASLGLGFGNWLSGGAIPTYQQVQEQLPISLPTGQDIKGAISKATGGFTEPQSGLESTARDVLGTAASLALPSRLLGKAGAGLSKILAPEKAQKVGKIAEKIFLPFSGLEVSPKKALGLATIGEVGAKGTEALGGGPVEQALTKMLFMGAANIKGTRAKLTEKMGDYFQKAEDSLNKSPLILTTGENANAASVAGIMNKVKVLEHELATSASPYKDNMSSVLGRIKEAVTNASPTKGGIGREHAVIKGSELMRIDKDLNQLLQLHEYPHFEGQPYLPKAVATEVKRMQTSVRDALEEIAGHNSEFKSNFYPAKDISSGLYHTFNLGKFFKSNAGLDEILKSKLSKAAFGIYGAHYAFTHPISTAAGIAGAIGGSELLKLRKLLQVPEARKAYEAAFKAASKNDLRDFIAHASKFDKYAQQIK